MSESKFKMRSEDGSVVFVKIEDLEAGLPKQVNDYLDRVACRTYAVTRASILLAKCGNKAPVYWAALQVAKSYGIEVRAD